MKKNKYIVPAMRVRVIEEEALMAASGVTNEGGQTIEKYDNPTKDGAGAKHSLFDTEWDN